MRRAAVPIGFIAVFTLIAPIGVAVTSSPSLPVPFVPDAARPALRLAAVVPSPDWALDQIAAAGTGAPAAGAIAVATEPAPAPQLQTIVSGDSSWGIARQYGVPVESRAESSRLSVTSGLRAPMARAGALGATTSANRAPQTAMLPRATAEAAIGAAASAQAAIRPAKPAVVRAKPAPRPPRAAAGAVAHVVVPGDTLWKIAATYGARIGDVMAQNGLGEDDILKPGQRVTVTARPSQQRVAPAPSALRPAAPDLEPQNGEALTPPPNVRLERAFLWPTRGVITSRFGWRRYRRHHEGIDLASPHGTPIYATGDGIVAFSGWRNGYGQVVYIDHGGGLTTIYGHASELLVAAGQKIKRGQMIARVGCTGLCTGAHVHFEVRINGVAVNPLQYLR